MGTDKRERQKAARQAKLEAYALQEQKTRRIRTGITAGVVVVLALGAAFAYSMIWGGDDGDDVAADETTTTTTANPEAIDPECPPDAGSPEPQQSFTGPPTMCIDPEASYVAKVETSRGEFEVALDAEQAPLTVNNFVFLARWRFYEGSTFHRIIPDFMIQGGDPVGDPPGTGGPGYNMGQLEDFDGEVPGEGDGYPLMSMAMANSGALEEGGIAPGSNGSQFFVVTGEQGQQLPPDYSLFGEVTSGEDVVMEIEGTGTPEGTPTETTTIEKITITQS